jgi:hypothetical protein
MIAYDLGADTGAGKALTSEIRALGNRWARPLAALWYVETSVAIDDVEGRLTPLIGDEDGLLIQEVTGQAALANTMLRWTGGPVLAAARVTAPVRSWQPQLVASGSVPTEVMPLGARLPISKTEVAAAA